MIITIKTKDIIDINILSKQLKIKNILNSFGSTVNSVKSY